MDWIDSAILESVRSGGAVASKAAEATGLARVTISRRLAKLVDAGYVVREGRGTRPRYGISDTLRWWQGSWPHDEMVRDGEQMIWAHHAGPLLDRVKPNVRSLAQTGFTEMLNNAIDHSDAQRVCVSVWLTPQTLQMAVMDDGVGIFNRIARFFDLPDRRLAVLELSKGKLTTAASGHSGIGVFVCSRMFDRFTIHSDSLVFTHAHDFTFDWLDDEPYRKGTVVLMEIGLDSQRTTMQVYERYFDPEEVGDAAFRTTEVPVRLAALGDDLVSRSQGKWVVSRIEQFSRVLLDFTGVKAVGQGFVDEVFRVFANAHPEVQLVAAHMEPEVERMVKMFSPRHGNP
jgi:anti-sigma regulatory factor (Ser/Thr protein kinase)/DNA-binding transcriptional ArsR family regulator